jgi:hypothetical protein
LPEWVNKVALSIFLKFINDDMLPKHMEANDALKVLWISDYFKVTELIDICINAFIIPQLSKDNILKFAQEAYNKLKANDSEEDVPGVWYEISYPQCTKLKSVLLKWKKPALCQSSKMGLRL